MLPADAFAVDVEDRGREFVVSADLPGLRTQDIDVTVKKDRVRIAADFEDDEDGRYLRRGRERASGERVRVLRLPQRVDEKRVSASFQDGVLRVHLRKAGGRSVDVS